MKQNFYEIFSQLNKIPRSSHHEERVADFLCEFATRNGLRYRRDAENCVVIEKDATPGYEQAEPTVLLNHMDMVCVAKDGYLRNGKPFDPLNDEIIPYMDIVKNEDNSETRWMKAEGTSLGADNGMGLSMALAVLTDDSLVHGPLEVLTTTNEEDGMSGAEALSLDFIRGRKILNLDSEAFDEITTGAAGAYIQVAHWKAEWKPIPEGMVFRRLVIDGGLGGHSGVDISKGRCNCIKEMCGHMKNLPDNNIMVCAINGGTANASIASWSEMIVALSEASVPSLEMFVNICNTVVSQRYSKNDCEVCLRIEETNAHPLYLANAADILNCISELPFGVMAMRKDMPHTVMTSNNIGVINTCEEQVTVSCHTRSFSDEEMHNLGEHIKQFFLACKAEEVILLMDTPAWMEREDSPLLALTCQTFKDVLGFEPKKVAMHFVLEAAYYVQKYPGVEIASIGPRIIEPHSTSERVDLDTCDKIWLVVVELLKRLAENK